MLINKSINNYFSNSKSNWFNRTLVSCLCSCYKLKYGQPMAWGIQCSSETLWKRNLNANQSLTLIPDFTRTRFPCFNISFDSVMIKIKKSSCHFLKTQTRKYKFVLNSQKSIHVRFRLPFYYKKKNVLSTKNFRISPKFPLKMWLWASCYINLKNKRRSQYRRC